MRRQFYCSTHSSIVKKKKFKNFLKCAISGRDLNNLLFTGNLSLSDGMNVGASEKLKG